jgi:hypothetical protein
MHHNTPDTELVAVRSQSVKPGSFRSLANLGENARAGNLAPRKSGAEALSDLQPRGQTVLMETVACVCAAIPCVSQPLDQVQAFLGDQRGGVELRMIA